MNEKNYIKLVEQVNKLEARVKTKDELIELLADTLIELQGTVAGLEEEIYSKQKEGGIPHGVLFFRENCNSYNKTININLRRSYYENI